ncbi:hypothetical protein ACEPAF_1462 [Sanghuangporus sanghuang]
MSTFPRGIKFKQSTISGATPAEPFLTRPTSDSNFNKNFDFDAGLNSSAAWTEHLHEHDLTKESEGDSLSIDECEEGSSSSGRQTTIGIKQDACEEHGIHGEEGTTFGPGRPARVLYNFSGEPALKELQLRAGDELDILRETIGNSGGWSLARVPRRVGGHKERKDEQEDANGDEIGLVPREYYAFTTDFISSPADATTSSRLRLDPINEESSDSPTPRASMVSSPKGPPLIPQNTGEWFRQQMRSVLGGRSLNRFSRFVTSGAEAFVLRGAPQRSVPHLPDSIKENTHDDVANDTEGKRTDGLPPAHSLRLSAFLMAETRGHAREPTAIPLEASPDAHYIDVGESGPTWRSKVPTFEVRVHSPEKRYPVPGLSSIVGGAGGGGEAGAYIVYSITSIFDSPSSDSEEDDDDLGSPTSSQAHSITVLRRFSHFVLLHSALSSLLPGLALPPLPEKQYAGRMNADFVDARRGELQRYLRMLVRHPVVRYVEPLRFFLGCEDEVEWRRQLPTILKLSNSLPSSSSSSSQIPPSFYANVYHPPFQIDLEDALDVSERFANHTHAVAQNVQHMRGMFTRGVRQARVEMANAERMLGYEILGLITGRLANGSGSTDSDEGEEEEDASVSPTRSPHGRTKQNCKQKKGLQNAEGAWCWREECPECLRLTKCMQKAAETLQGVADLYDNHARRTMLETEDSLKDVAHPDVIYAPVLDIHRQTLERYKEASESTEELSRPDVRKNDEANEAEAIHASSGEEEDSVAARCETVLNTTLAEFDAYHTAKRDDFERIVTSHLDGEIAFYEKVLMRLRTTRALFDTSPTELDLLMPGARQSSIYERTSHVSQFHSSTEPLTQPAPHVLDSGRRATMRPVSNAIQGLLGIAAGSSGSKFMVNGVKDGAEGASSEGQPGENGSGSVFSRLW